MGDLHPPDSLRKLLFPNPGFAPARGDDDDDSDDVITMLLTRCRDVTQWCFSVPPLSLAQSVSQPISSQSCAFINATDTLEETIEIWETNENPKVSQFCVSV